MDCGPAPSRNLTFRRLYVVPAAGPSTEAKHCEKSQKHSKAHVVIQQHKFGRMYLCGWSKRWGAIVCANRFVAIKYPTEDEAKLVRDHAAARCPNFTVELTRFGGHLVT